jgi:hypothetical protein
MSEPGIDGNDPSGLADSFIILIDEPSFEVEDSFVRTSQLSESLNASNLPQPTAGQPGKEAEGGEEEGEGEDVYSEVHLKPTLFSIDLFVHDIKYKRPASFPKTGLQVVFKFMDFPPVRMSKALEELEIESGEGLEGADGAGGSNVALDQGKSCLFRSSYADLKSRVNVVPLYVMLLLDNAGNDDAGNSEKVDHFVGSAAVDLSSYVESIEGGHLNVPIANDGYVTGLYRLYNLVGREAAQVKISLRVKNFGVHMLSHFMRVHGKTGLPSVPTADAASPSRPVHLSPPVKKPEPIAVASYKGDDSVMDESLAGAEDTSMDSDETFGIEDDSVSSRPTSEQWALGMDESVDDPATESRESDIDRALRLMKPRVLEVGNSFGESDMLPVTSHHEDQLPSGLLVGDALPPAMVYTHIGPSDDDDEEGPSEPPVDEGQDSGRETAPFRTKSGLRIGSGKRKPNQRPTSSSKAPSGMVASPRPTAPPSRGQRGHRVSPRNSIRKLNKGSSAASPRATPVSRNDFAGGKKQGEEEGSEAGVKAVKLSAADRRKRERQLRAMWSGKMNPNERAFDGRQ